jgi:hypothetical protein
VSLHRNYLNLRVRKRDHIPDGFAEEHACERRNIGNRALRRVGFVLPDDPERLPPAILAVTLPLRT